MYFVLGDNERISNGVEKLSIASLLTSKINSKSLSTSSTSQLIIAELKLTLSKVSAFKNLGGSISSIGSVVTVKVFVTKLLFKSVAIMTRGYVVSGSRLVI